MQATRQQIINMLNEQGKATVDELALTIGLTPMAVRHHLNVLQSDNLVTSMSVRRHDGPGRPSQIYKLTEAADTLFPSDYQGLTGYLLNELIIRFGQEEINNLFKSIGNRLANETPPVQPGQTIEDRLNGVIHFLNKKGFVAELETTNENYLVHTYSCPYRKIAKEYSVVCLLDKQIISTMLNTTPTRTACLISTEGHCTYQISRKK
jgi:predicted ArsR family transcriptional regulator